MVVCLVVGVAVVLLPLQSTRVVNVMGQTSVYDQGKGTARARARVCVCVCFRGCGEGG